MSEVEDTNRFRKRKPLVVETVPVVEEEIGELVELLSPTVEVKPRVRRSKDVEIIPERTYKTPMVETTPCTPTTKPKGKRPLLSVFSPKNDKVIVEKKTREGNRLNRREMGERFYQYMLAENTNPETGEVYLSDMSLEKAEALISLVENFFTEEVVPNYDSFKFLDTMFRKVTSGERFTIFPVTKRSEGIGYTYKKGFSKLTCDKDLPNEDSIKSWLYLNEEQTEVIKIEKYDNATKKSEVVLDGSFDYLVPVLFEKLNNEVK